MIAQGIVLVLIYPLCPNFNKKTHLRFFFFIKLAADFA